ncbi:AlkA N-terminal domain-containing protein [Antricoccus suffuscus]|nr:AlkA N-terminal domain-containing protein [Antricoccus suffuscus]
MSGPSTSHTTGLPDPDACYRAVTSRDHRYDGWIYVAVRSTGIYCRPSCSSVTPRRENCSFHSTAAAAQQAGYRACLRCRPDVVPGSPQWDLRADTVGRAMRMISDGVVDRDGVSGLATRLGYSERQLNRLISAELGAPPVALARAQRAHTARVLIEGTTMPMADIAFAAGFSSVRQFNDTVRAVFAQPPTALRTRHSTHASDGGELLSLRLPVREPFHADGIFDFFERRQIAGIETARRTPEGWVYARTVGLAHGAAALALHWNDGQLTLKVSLEDFRDLTQAVRRARRLLDLDADPVAVDTTLCGASWLKAYVEAAPGLRVPGVLEGHELAIRALLGQQISVAAAANAGAKLVARYGALSPVTPTEPGLTHLFPSSAALAEVDSMELPMPRSRATALVGLGAALASGAVDLDIGSDRLESHAQLLALKGIGPWTADYVTMRALGDPDVFLSTDLIVRRAAAAAGMPADLGPLDDAAKVWAPWRSYATMHLWRASPQLLAQDR